jgi:sensor domain CHASE-containing protein
LTILLLISVIFIFSVLFLQRSSNMQEENQIRSEVSRAFIALADEEHKIDMFVYDYAAWDDSYAFIRNGNKKYIESNLSDEGFLRNRWSYAVYVNTAGKIICARGYDLVQKRSKPVPQGLLRHLEIGSPLTTHKKLESVVQGVLVLDDAILLVSSRPILTTQYQGPIAGAFILAREMSQAEVRQMGVKIGLSIALYRMDDPSAAQTIASLRSLGIADTTIVVRVESPVQISGYLLLKDI